jgi:hypothetical protein
MPRYYFHVKDGRDLPDLDGTELADITAARQAAVTLSGEILRDGIGDTLWSGIPWEIQVTDSPRGQGHEFFSLYFSTHHRTAGPL